LKSQALAVTLSKLDQEGLSGSGGVEIAGFPQMLHTSSFGHPDMLFVPLLEGAREAVILCERVTAGGETPEHAAAMSGIQLVSSLMRESGFSLSARGIQEEHHYFLDLSAGTISLQTRLYAEVSRRTSLFKVEIAGSIQGGVYAVRIAGDPSVNIQFNDEQVRQPMFFSTTLAEQCLRLQVQRDHSKRMIETSGEEHAPEVHLTVRRGNQNTPLILKKKDAGGEWEVLDGNLRARLAMLSPDAGDHLRLLLAALTSMLAGDAEAPQPTSAPSPALAGAAKEPGKT
jgi:hypothetical protein